MADLNLRISVAVDRDMNHAAFGRYWAFSFSDTSINVSPGFDDANAPLLVVARG